MLDVRTQIEFAAGHPPQARNVPWQCLGPRGRQPNVDFAAVIEGKVSEEDFRKLADRFDAKIEGDEGFDEDDARQIFKAEMDSYSSTRSGSGMSVLALY